MSVLCAMLTRRYLTISTTAISAIPPSPKLNRERLWKREVDQVRVSRGSQEETAMATTPPKKPLLQSAAANSYSKAGAEMKKAAPQLPRPEASPDKSVETSRADEKGSESH